MNWKEQFIKENPPGIGIGLIPLTKGQCAVVDAERYEDLLKFQWFAIHIRRDKHRHTEKWYAARVGILNGRKKHILMHRELLGLSDAEEGDHIDGDGLNNRLRNLRPASGSENMWGQKVSVGRKKTSQYKGVFWNSGLRRWTTRICYKRHHMYIGSFQSEKEAALYYDVAAQVFFGRFASLNGV